jgi:hypothetical protein
MSVVPVSVLNAQTSKPVGSTNYLTDAINSAESIWQNVTGNISAGVEATAAAASNTADTVGTGLTSIGTGIQTDFSLVTILALGLILLIIIRPETLKAVPV